MVFSANNNFYDLCKLINSLDSLKIYKPDLLFYDIKKNKSWQIGISLKDLVFNEKSRIPEVNFFEYFSILKILFAKNTDTVGKLIKSKNLKKLFWEPITLAVMNTCVDKASAKILSNVLKKTVFSGSKKCNIYQPKNNWNKTLIEPALSYINKNNNIFFKQRLKKFIIKDNHIIKLIFNNKEIKLSKNDLVVSALSLSSFKKILPQHKIPENFNTILNVHFKINEKIKKLFGKEIIGMISSKSQWVFVKNNYISVTISDANSFDQTPSNEIAKEIWREICLVTKKQIDLPVYQIIKEKKATFEQSPENFEKIKKINNLPCNLILSGDWTQVDLPCTIEGSIKSGKKAIDFLNI